MPSPFPGMDPYLESPQHWRGAHHNLITAIASHLNRTLPPGFAATIDERVYVVPPDRHVFPDVAVLRDNSKHVRRDDDTRGGVATLAPYLSADSPLIVSLRDEPTRESFVEVRTVNSAATLVAVIEVLSPANKELGSEGRAQYRRKQREVLASDAHLLEIDLLRGGEYTTAAPPELIAAEIGNAAYVTCLHRSGKRWEFELWPSSVRERLPRVAVPLLGNLPDMVLDLQAAFDWTYDIGPYSRIVDYRAEPTPALQQGDAVWADALLQEAGSRS